MFPLSSLRVAARRVAISPALVRTTGLTSRWVPNALTRSFITSVARAEPTKSKTVTKAKDPATKKPVKKTIKKPVKAKAVKKKPVKKVAKPTIPKGIKIPLLGPSPYIYYITNVYQQEHPVTKENFSANAKAAGEAWNALPESEKEKYSKICSPLRAKASEERQAYVNNLPSSVLKEINRRRTEKGKVRLHKTIKREGYVVNCYTRWIKDYYKKHPEVFRTKNALTQIGQIWKGLSAQEKQPYIDEYNAAKEEMIAQKNA